MTNSEFLTTDNMKFCQGIFHTFMMERYGFNIQIQGSKTNLKKLLYDIMIDVDKQYKHEQVELKILNNITLNIARDFYKSNYKIVEIGESKPNVKNLERDHTLYGPRLLNMEQIKPEPTFKRNVDSVFEQEEQRRKMEQQQQPKIPNEMAPVLENAFDPDEFMRKVSELEKKRDDIEILDLTGIQNARMEQDTSLVIKVSENPKQLYQMTQEQNQKACEDAKPDLAQSGLRETFITPLASTKTILLDKYLAINGFDRNWIIEKNRFNFKVDFSYSDNSLKQRYRNIKTIEATRAIIPMEIFEVISVNNVPKTNYNYEFSFAYPYITLNVDEINDVYDGTNDNIRRSFCQFVFDKCYKSPNGRGYIILNPIQKERKLFYPAPLPSLNRLSLSLRKPNGDLLNNSRDEYKIFKVEYEVRNKKYLKIVTNIYFDKNEFFRGDTILLTGYTMTMRDPGMSSLMIQYWHDFINRKQGHDILEIGQANDQGYFRTFYIEGPGAFDVNIGEFVINQDMITTLNLYNNTYNYSNITDTNGAIINCSLQCVITFKLQESVTDAGVIVS
jgi:hypothetical protein